jgi:hypothetical protein
MQTLIRIPGDDMIAESLLGASLLLNVSLDLNPTPAVEPASWPRLSVADKSALMLPLVRRATDCIVRRVKADPRYRSGIEPAAVNELIAASFTACRLPVRAMIEAHDQMFGDGSGEAFLLGPYLDILPAAVVRQVRMPR